jgi:hypothetical protein
VEVEGLIHNAAFQPFDNLAVAADICVTICPVHNTYGGAIVD